MSVPIVTAEKLVAIGANLVLESPYPIATLETLVATAKNTGATITIKGPYPLATMENLAAIGKNHVTFVI
jgi:hypothetical protein